MKRFLLSIGLVAGLLSSAAIAQTARVPSVSQIGADRWVKNLTQVLKLTNASVEIGDAEELRRQSRRVSQLIGEAGGWPEDDAWRRARINCVMTAQALSNYITDIGKGSARGLVSARAEIKMLGEWSPKCDQSLSRIKR